MMKRFIMIMVAGALFAALTMTQTACSYQEARDDIAVTEQKGDTKKQAPQEVLSSRQKRWEQMDSEHQKLPEEREQ